MSADIHTMLEKEIDGKWVLIHTPHWNDAGERRNYDRFAKLAGVRGDGPAPKGVPSDISEGAQYRLRKWDCDAHSVSYDTLIRFLEVCKETERDNTWDYSSYKTSDFCEYYLGIRLDEDECVDDFRVVYWFDN
jgi:hypothetical protein